MRKPASACQEPKAINSSAPGKEAQRHLSSGDDTQRETRHRLFPGPSANNLSYRNSQHGCFPEDTLNPSSHQSITPNSPAYRNLGLSNPSGKGNPVPSSLSNLKMKRQYNSKSEDDIIFFLRKECLCHGSPLPTPRSLSWEVESFRTAVSWQAGFIPQHFLGGNCFLCMHGS
jgi:hypothetical protein